MTQASFASAVDEEVAAVMALNTLLQLEQEMAESYQLAIDRLRSDAIGELFDCLYSHRLRIEYISERIHELGVQPHTNPRQQVIRISGLTGTDRRDTLLALRDLEAQCLARYRYEVLALDDESLLLAECTLFPEQHRTVHVMDGLFPAAS